MLVFRLDRFRSVLGQEFLKGHFTKKHKTNYGIEYCLPNGKYHRDGDEPAS